MEEGYMEATDTTLSEAELGPFIRRQLIHYLRYGFIAESDQALLRAAQEQGAPLPEQIRRMLNGEAAFVEHE